ncbi:hypothetical protein, partial [Pseudomonas bubulae]|uniref:hypothetical protein n=1 Tax=Pseudomonas bubulae TaxID=2316085 RepID=UPI002B1E1A02
RIAFGKANVELAGMLQQRLDDQPTTWADNTYDQRHVLYFSAELEFLHGRPVTDDFPFYP